MTPTQVQYIRDRLADWERVPDECGRTAALLLGGNPTQPGLVIEDQAGRVLWTTEDLVRTARHLRVLVDACEASLCRPEGDADRAWAIAFLGSLALIWSDRPDYPKAEARRAD